MVMLAFVVTGCGGKSTVSQSTASTDGDGAGSVSSAPAGGDASSGTSVTPMPGTPPSSDTASAVSPSPAMSTGDTSSQSTGIIELPPGPVTLNGAPLVFAPTKNSFSVSAVISTGVPEDMTARIKKAGTDAWSEPIGPLVRANDVGEWAFTGLEAETQYDYQVTADDEGDESRVLFDGHALTQRLEGSTFKFAMVSDTHIGANLDFSNQGDELLTAEISAELAQSAPDFMLNLGDLLDYHEFGFNVPVSDPLIAKWAYQNYRNALGNTIGQLAHFSVVGNWDGENGDFSDEEINRSRDQRMLYLPNPNPSTYPQGGGPSEDYYAFTWGDAMFAVLNVQTYTPTSHLLSGVGEYPDDWTLGEDQLSWLETTLANATSKWKFLFIHHTVGGAGPSVADAAYGRGGGQAAYVGQQAIVHQMMLDYGVQVFFYGHDHVFVDMEVDGIHYSDPGSAGAPWKFESEDTGYTEYWTDSGWARVTVSPEQVHVEFLAVGGALLHEYTIPPTPRVEVDGGARVTSESPNVDAGPDAAL